MLQWIVIISVISLIIFSLLKVHVLLALIISSLLAGVLSGLDLVESLKLLVNGMGGQSSTALSYVLLGAFAVAISYTGITSVLVNILTKRLSGRRASLLLTIAFIASLSQNLVPVHIAFIPLLIPPLLKLFDVMKLDRRAVATALTFGLKAPYIMIPAGYGLLFHQIIGRAMSAQGMDVDVSDISLVMIIPGIGMIVGLFIAIFFTYRHPRTLTRFGEVPQVGDEPVSIDHFSRKHVFTLISIVAALAVQIISEELIFGALVGILLMFLFNVVPFTKIDHVMGEGIKMMSTIALVMLVASGFSHILQETGSIDALIASTDGLLNQPRAITSVILLLVGLVITMGIGSSFATVPILAALYVPIGLTIGFSPLAIVALIGTAGALGDAGSPASDSTLGPTSGLNADGKHNHIWDTCVPTFLHFNIPLLIFGVIASLIF